MVKVLKLPEKAIRFFKAKAYQWGSGGGVAWYGGYPYFFQDKKVRLENNTVIQACIGWESRNFCEPPGCIQTLSPSGEIETEFDHDLAQLFRRPEPEGKMTGRRLMKALLASRRLDGNGYLDVVRTEQTKKPVELRFIPPWAVKPIAAKGTGLLDHYEITLKGGKVDTREIDEIFHTSDGIDEREPLKGCSALKTAMRLVMTDTAATESAERMIRNLGVVGLALSPKNGHTIKDDATRKALAQELTQRFAGEGQGSAFVGSGEFELQYYGTDASKLGFREMHRIPEERITAIFGYAAIVIGLGAGLDRSTFANFSEAREAATEQTLVPLWSELADDITVQLGPQFGLKPNQSFAYDLKNVKILQEDEDKRWGRLGTAFQHGGIKRSEYRTAIGYEASAEDELYIQDIYGGGQGDTQKNAETAKLMRQIKRRSHDSRAVFEAIQAEL